ncbi:LY6E protein, partial [Pitta sordida]|nr:LY6E protein [Pitta sordida]
SLRCFTCKDATSNLHCLESAKCSDDDQYCLTTYSTIGIGKDRSQRITKKCSATCPSLDVNIGIAGIATSCCQKSYCNFSGASSVKTSYTIITLGVLASLACILRMGF